MASSFPKEIKGCAAPANRRPASTNCCVDKNAGSPVVSWNPERPIVVQSSPLPVSAGTGLSAFSFEEKSILAGECYTSGTIGQVELRFIDESSIRFWRDAGAAMLRCEIAEDRCILQTRIRRCFPLSHPEDHVSILEADGKEVGILRSPRSLDADSHKLVCEELDRLYFTPTISRIAALKQEASMWKWEVETQRGPAQFYLRGVRDSVHEVAPGRFQIYSVDGQRYELRDYDKLDARTQNLFESLF